MMTNSRKTWTTTMVLVGLFSGGAALAAPPYGDPNQPYDQLPGTWETYHVKWLKPLAGGRIKALL